MSNGVHRIQRVSRFMKALCTAILVVVPAVLVLVWVYFADLAHHFGGLGKIPYDLERVGWPHLLAGFAVSMVPAVIVLYGVSRLRRLFDLYGRGIVFGTENAGCIRGFAISLIGAAALKPFVGAALSVILTISNDPGKRVLSVELSSTDLALLFLGGVLLVISWVMREGSVLADENAQIV